MTQGGIFMVSTKRVVDSLIYEEGFRSRVYKDIEGNASIGIGHWLHDGPPTAADKALVWTIEKATEMMAAETSKIEAAINNAVRVSLNHNQFDSLVMHCYNIGCGKLTDAKRTWLRYINSGNFAAVPSELERWCKYKDAKTGEMKTSAVLLARRKREAALFAAPAPSSYPDPDEKPAVATKETQSIYSDKTKTQLPERWE